MSLTPVTLVRVGKLVRLLGSPVDGEVVAAARALDRALKADGADLHTLADRLTASMTSANPPDPSWSDIYHRAARAAEAARKAPPAWPSFGRLKHSQRLAWLDVMPNLPYSMERNTRASFDVLRTKLYHRPHEVVTSAEVRLFNRIVRVAWNLGARV